VDVHDPCVDPEEALAEYGITLISKLEAAAYDGVILAVAHDSYRDAGAAALRGSGRKGHVFFDLKSVFERDESDLRL
jgi:UDP-N-acetyl-D-galactosamine dehydrogenase